MFALFSQRSAHEQCVWEHDLWSFGWWDALFCRWQRIFYQKELPNNTWFKQQIERLLLTTYRLNVCISERWGRETSGLTPVVVGPFHVNLYYSFETHTELTSVKVSKSKTAYWTIVEIKLQLCWPVVNAIHSDRFKSVVWLSSDM